MFKVYTHEDYISEDGKYITTPEIDSCSEITLGVFIFVMGLILPMVGIYYGF